MPEPAPRGEVGQALAECLAGTGQGGSLRFSIVSLAETTSTNDVARSLAMAGAPEGTVVVADTQTSGRGRLAEHGTRRRAVGSGVLQSCVHPCHWANWDRYRLW